jgi:hypothetical protein
MKERCRTTYGIAVLQERDEVSMQPPHRRVSSGRSRLFKMDSRSLDYFIPEDWWTWITQYKLKKRADMSLARATWTTRVFWCQYMW